MYRARASEFPNDNAELHRGAVWVREEPCGPLASIRLATPEPPKVVELPEPVAASSGDAGNHEPSLEALILETACAEPSNDGTPSPAAVEARTTEPPPTPDAFTAFVHALVAVALADGAPRAAAALPALLEHGRLDIDALDDAALDALEAGGMIARTSEGPRPSEQLAAVCGAWRDVLRGAGDFSACGPSTLNEFAAELLAAVLGAPKRAPALQAELRRHGVAAFGMLGLAA